MMLSTNDIADAAAFIAENDLEYEDAAEAFVSMTGQAIVTSYGSYADMHERSLSLTLHKPDGTADDLGDLVDTLDKPQTSALRQRFLAAVQASGAQYGMDFGGEAGDQTAPLPIADYVKAVLDRHFG